MTVFDDLMAKLQAWPRGAVTLDPSDAQALAVLAVAGRATVADRISDADLIERLASALAVVMHVAGEPEGVDPMAWLQANTALAAAGRAPVAPPANHRATWLARRSARGLGPF